MAASSDELPLVVLATDSTAPSGVGEHMLTLAQMLLPIYRIILAFPPKGDGVRFLTRGRNQNMDVKEIENDSGSFASWLKSQSASLLHVHAGIGWEGHGLASSAWIADIPVIRTEHLPYLLTDVGQKTEYYLGVQLINRIILVSEGARESYRRAGFSDSRLRTIVNGIKRPESARSRAQTRASLHVEQNTQLVITVARFTPQKGHSTLLTAAKEVLFRNPTIRFLLVGEGDDRTEMQALAVNLGISDMVDFLGEREDVPDLLAAADIFVLPSFFEGLPLAVLEAMAIGVPIVATHIDGTTEALGIDYPWLVPTGDHKSLGLAITAALTNVETRQAIGKLNKLRFEEHFTAERMGSATAAIYREVINEKATLT